MKNLATLFFLFALAPLAYTQSQEAAPPAKPDINTDMTDPIREATDKLSQKYKLDAEQASRMFTIQNRKHRNLKDIAAFKTSNPTLYSSKLNSVQKGTQASIRRMLNTEVQLGLYQQTMAKQRRLRGEKRQELLAKGTAPVAIEAALLDIYFE